jgi:copper chaperone NosL
MRNTFARLICGLMLLLVACKPDLSPRAVAWDRERCAHCEMHVGDPRFAVQILTRSGQAFFFDDPGCANEWRKAHEGEIAAAWYHDSKSERWLSDSEVAFVESRESPMGHGIASVARETKLEVTR